MSPWCHNSPEVRTKPCPGSHSLTAAELRGEQPHFGLAGGEEQQIFHDDIRQILLVVTERRLKVKKRNFYLSEQV